MAIEYADLTQERLDDLKDLLLPYWQRAWSAAATDAFFRWRFLERPDWQAVMAYDGTRAVAFLDSFVRPHRIGAEVVRIRETADWYCHADYRPLVGIKLMRMMMEKPEPMLVSGGTEHTQKLLPAMRWHTLPGSPRYVLRLGAGALFKGLSKLLKIPLSAFPVPLARPLSFRIGGAHRGPPPGAETSVTRLRGNAPLPEIVPSPDTCMLSAVLGQQEVDWLGKVPDAMGEFIWLVFSVDGAPVGHSLSRIYQEKPFQAAKLLHIQANAPAAGLYAWMIADTATYLAAHGAQWVAARFSCPILGEAFRETGFTKRPSRNAYWWDHGRDPPDGPFSLTWMCADEGLLPYPA